jgi:hypothetical protein
VTLRGSTRHSLIVVQLVFCLSLIVRAQVQGPPSRPTPGTTEPKTITIKGCMSGYEGRYTIGTARDDLYLLEGDVATFKRYNGKMVEATGTLAPAARETSPHDALSEQPPQLTVTNLKKLADRCGN